ncbi:MAG: hypothetical protein L6R38_004113 [Xanthoria sp. 2 TBL-2021]|nr:MAG: hypothetical protein L6R38_004113 [Xanthoria sp. 2 TBL-2021]
MLEVNQKYLEERFFGEAAFLRSLRRIMDGSKPKAHVHEQTSRTREKPSGDEEATAELKLGEFQNVPTLSLSEARLLINAVLDNRRKLRKVNETE